MSVKLDRERCKGCKLCTTVCPVDILVMEEEETNSQGFHPSTVTDQDKCISCGFCARICPDMVIEVVEEDKN